MVTLHDTRSGLPSADGGMTVGLSKLSSLDGRRPPYHRPQALARLACGANAALWICLYPCLYMSISMSISADPSETGIGWDREPWQVVDPGEQINYI